MKQALKWALVASYLALLILPGYVFFSIRGGLVFLTGTDLRSALVLLFPLFGLYAFTFVSLQVLIGSNMLRLRPVFPKIMIFHRFHGLLALTFACLHPLMILAAFGIVNSWHLRFVSPRLRIWVLVALLAISLLLLTVTTAVAAWKFGKFTGVWRKIHLLNYLVYALVWLHSWFIGSDIQATNLRYIWMLYALAVAASLTARIIRGRTA